jgi:hypothetical protein
MRRTLFILANAVVIGLAFVHLYDAWQVNRFAGVGGPEVYRAARLEQLEQARNRIGHLEADVAERELAAIDEQIAELRNGSEAGELGGELWRVK